MRVTAILLRFHPRLPRGCIWRGKERLVKQVTPEIIAKKRHEFELEEKNMFYLRHPYLTAEQEKGHTVPFKHHEKFIDGHNARRAKNWWPHKLLGDKFGFLKVSESWE